MAESLKHVILRLAEERAGATFSPTEAAMALRPPRPDEVKGEEKWRKRVDVAERGGDGGPRTYRLPGAETQAGLQRRRHISQA